ncbi:MAG: hypothetical protein A3G32_02995 [Deltaproteobacteria bacterium RIFCSPLOWO2_12_FULL_40_28]|nr:MAG: hypothetical protein A3C45_01680 [Deltaproteobacteria bacterium RIFCSPHIGHO2_02_FULL_40_28]OGQ19518.1 MAG: hypothetical protein A3E27_02180 [Deltaproteobacteria bacterium RIFCSPHIGHO2_12_FULL_40_32]OGQ39992.1 MAG: hypothetical protein A3I69_08145 [Deltaproteobacteria bacterium RIFCSPLOWO2_02_FULL_40_36]OGQ54335.1 MAG: hypothetical protein A3G32_02995 [Deltaproteobacteria bacterium RIFCSPLOWO2_12_FULL_40_28]
MAFFLKKNKNTLQEKTSEETQGIFIEEEKKSSKPLNQRIYLLLGILICLVAFSFVMRFFAGPIGEQGPSLDELMPASREKIRQMIQSSKNNKKVVDLEMANQLFTSGQYDEALALYRQVVANDPNNWQAYNSLGLVYLKKELFDNAEDYFKKALELNTECAPCSNNMGYLMTLKNKNDEAQIYLNKATLLNDKYADPYFNLGVLFEKKKEIQLAVDAYKKFIELAIEAKPEFKNQVEARIKELTGL